MSDDTEPGCTDFFELENTGFIFTPAFNHTNEGMCEHGLFPLVFVFLSRTQL